MEKSEYWRGNDGFSLVPGVKGVFRQFLGNFHGRWMDIQECFSFSYRLNETFFICFVCGPWTSAKKRTTVKDERDERESQ